MLKKTDPDIIQGYLEDSSALKNGKADCVLIPENESEIVEIVKQASKNIIPTTLSAGKTGTTGGCIPFKGQILSLEKLNKIIKISPSKKTAVCQPGITIENLEKSLDKFDLAYPPDPTEKTAFLGGTVATNASGARSFRFGPTRNWINRLRIVLSTGEILNLSRGKKQQREQELLKIIRKSTHYKMPQVKNAAGYFIKPDMDLIDLFIGSEGTLGIITEIEIKLLPKNKDIFECAAFFTSKEDALNFAQEAKTKKPLSLEYFDAHSLEHLRPKFSKIPPSAQAAVMFEQDVTSTSLSDQKDIEEYAKLLEKFNCPLDNVWFAETEKERENLRLLRHALPEICNEIFKRSNQTKISTDIAVPEKYNIEMVNYYDEILIPSQLDYLYFGHIGDNHIHVNIFPKNEKERKTAKDIYMQFIKKAVSLGGTISAEHGIGKIKTEYLKIMYGEKIIEEMKMIKKILDPAYILNLGNIFQA